jgi:hypothetical protein
VQTRLGHCAQAENVLALFDARRQKPLRQAVDFAPGQSALATHVVAEQEVTELQQQARRWQKVAVAALAFLLLGGALGLAWHWSAPRREVRTGARPASFTIAEVSPQAAVDLLTRPSRPQAQPPDGWRVDLGCAQEQEVRWQPDGLYLRSGDATRPLEVDLPMLHVGRWRRLQLRVEGAAAAPFRGELPLLVVDFLLADGSETLRAFTKGLVAKGEEWSTQQTVRLRQDVRAVRVRLTASFTGAALIRTLSVVPKEDDEKKD